MTRSNIEIRDATPGDAAAIVSIYAEHILHGTATFEVDPPGAAEMKRRWSSIATAGWPYLVAAQDGAVVGYAYAAQLRDRAGYRHSA